MNEAKDRMRGWKKMARALALGGAVVGAVILTLGNADRNAASSRPRTDNGAPAVMRASSALDVAAPADSGEETHRVPAHPELDLQLD